MIRHVQLAAVSFCLVTFVLLQLQLTTATLNDDYDDNYRDRNEDDASLSSDTDATTTSTATATTSISTAAAAAARKSTTRAPKSGPKHHALSKQPGATRRVGKGQNKGTHRLSNRNTNRSSSKAAAAAAAAAATARAANVNANAYNDPTDDKLRAAAAPVAVNLTAKVGESVILMCAINSSYGANPGVIWMQGKLGNVLTLNTNRITLDARFDIVQQSAQQAYFQESGSDTKAGGADAASAALHPLFASVAGGDESSSSSSNSGGGAGGLAAASAVAQNELSFYNLRIDNVQIYDENEYACQTSITKRNDDEPDLHSLVYLHVMQSPSFIESLTSESNLAALEHGDAILKCFSVGKPAPKIRWYQIDDETDSVKDLDNEAPSLTIRNVSRHDSSKFECVASNGILPSVSKKFTLTVHYAPIVNSVRSHVYQHVGQTVVLGCAVNSNPDSSITWYRLVASRKLNATPHVNELSDEAHSDFVRVDAPLHSRFQIHRSKQINQTVSYFKIKNLELSDYTKYKCEATNVVGKAETVIQLIDIQDTDKLSHLERGRMRHHSKEGKSNNNHLHIKVHNGDMLSVNSHNKVDGDYDSKYDFESSNADDYEDPTLNSVEDLNEYSRLNGVVRKPLHQHNSMISSSSKPPRQHGSNGKRKQPKHFQHNKTAFKYQINKSSRIIESENSLHRLDSAEAFSGTAEQRIRTICSATTLAACLSVCLLAIGLAA